MPSLKRFRLIMIIGIDTERKEGVMTIYFSVSYVFIDEMLFLFFIRNVKINVNYFTQNYVLYVFESGITKVNSCEFNTKFGFNVVFWMEDLLPRFPQPTRCAG